MRFVLSSAGACLRPNRPSQPPDFVQRQLDRETDGQQSFVIAAARARNAHNPAPLAAQSQYPTKPLSIVLAEYAVVITAVTVGAGLLLGF